MVSLLGENTGFRPKWLLTMLYYEAIQDERRGRSPIVGEVNAVI